MPLGERHEGGGANEKIRATREREREREIEKENGTDIYFCQIFNNTPGNRGNCACGNESRDCDERYVQW